MARIIVFGAGIGGLSMAHELKETIGRAHQLPLVSNNPYFQFTPSNPWVGVGWRTKENITLDLAPLMAKHGITFLHGSVARLHPAENRLELADGASHGYDYLVATGPELAFDEVPGLGPEGRTQSVCTVDHATRGCETSTLAHDDPDDGGVVQQAIEQAGNVLNRTDSDRRWCGNPAEGWSQPRFEELL